MGFIPLKIHYICGMEFYESKQIGLATGAVELISVAQAKSWALIDTTADDTVITDIIISARQMIEVFVDKDFVAKDREYFVSIPESNNMIILPFNADTSTIVVIADGITLTITDSYKIVGIGGKYIQLLEDFTNVKITYTSEPISSPSELALIESATKVLIEKIYNNRGDIEHDNSPEQLMDMSIISMLNPLRTMYL